ncbi:MAG: phosphotransferase [Planctomycetota bacterium]
MDVDWKDELKAEHLLQAQRAWGLHGAPVYFREGESFVYRARHGTQDLALRITHPGHRDPAALESELAFMEYVGSAGVRVPRVVPSRQGRRIETLEIAGFTWYACVFEWVAGEPMVQVKEAWQAPAFTEWGRQIGRLQRLAMEATQRGLHFPRHRFDAPGHYALDDNYLERFPADRDSMLALQARIAAVEITPRTFGLCHCDLHGGNLLYDAGALHCIDFDDCCEHYFLFDLLIPVYYAILMEQEDLEGAARRFALPFFRGYREEGPLAAADFAPAGDFLRIRDYELKSIGQRWGVDPKQPWYAVPARNVREGNPFVGFPWADWFEEAGRS